MLRSILRFPDPAEPAGGPTADPPAPVVAAPAAAPVTDRAPPPAGTVIASAEVTEETERLRRENEQLARTVKDRETEVASVRDEFAQYRQTVEEPKRVPVKKTRSFGFFTEEVE